MPVFDPDKYMHPYAYIVIRNNTTAEIKTVRWDLPWYEHSLFFWTDGNFGCDCNRHDLFVGHHDGDKQCGGSMYTVIKAVFPDGSEQVIDELPENGQTEDADD